MRVLWCISFTSLCEFLSPFQALQGESSFQNFKCNPEFPKYAVNSYSCTHLYKTELALCLIITTRSVGTKRTFPGVNVMNDPPRPFLIPKKEPSMLFNTKKNYEFLISLRSFLELKPASLLQLNDQIECHCSKLTH